MRTIDLTAGVLLLTVSIIFCIYSIKLIIIGIYPNTTATIIDSYPSKEIDECLEMRSKYIRKLWGEEQNDLTREDFDKAGERYESLISKYRKNDSS